MLKSVLVLPLPLYLKAKDQADKQGITLLELCQKACVCRLDEVKASKPYSEKVPEATGLEA